MLETLLNLFENYEDKCSITNMRNGCVSFARNRKYLDYLSTLRTDSWIIIPKISSATSSGGIKFYSTDYPEYEFTLFHNEIHKNKPIQEAVIGDNCDLHETVILSVEGLKVVNTPSGDKIQFKHTGRVVIGDNVNIGAYSIVHRGTMGDTIIESGCKFGVNNNIGHNCHIGKNTVMAVGVILNGGVKVGKNCWFSSGVLVRHYTTICDNVVIGLGSVVIKDITKPGIYIGNPAKFLKPITEGWNF